MMASKAIDQSRFEALMGKALTDIGGALAVLMAYMGDRLGLYRVLDEHGAAKGYFEACGIRPRILDRLRERGAELPEHLFQRRQLASWSAHSPTQAGRAGGNGHPGGAHGRH